MTAATLAADLRGLIWRLRPVVTVVLGPAESAIHLGRLLADAGLSGTLVMRTDCDEPDCDEPGWGDGGLAQVGVQGTLAQLLADRREHGLRLDLIVLTSDEPFGPVLDALDAVIADLPEALPDIAVCSDDVTLINRAFFDDPTRYGRVIHRFAMVLVEPHLICFTGRRQGGG